MCNAGLQWSKRLMSSSGRSSLRFNSIVRGGKAISVTRSDELVRTPMVRTEFSSFFVS
jgi:hypothetical protein